jgi:putative ABC transport system permease protein
MRTLKMWRAMATMALRMMVHDRLKMIGILIGVVFAVLLTNQNAGTFLGLLYKNTMYLDNSGADVWIAPPSTEQLQAGKTIPDATMMQARVTPGVAWAEPILFGGATVSLPGGGSEQIQLVGVRGPDLKGGPWNMVSGRPDAILEPDTMIFEDSQRETLGGLNVGSLREVNGHRVVVGGFTWGLLPFGPSFAFADYDLAREILHTDSDRVNYVLVGLEPGRDPDAVARDLQARVPDAKVMTRSRFKRSLVGYVLTRTPIGTTMGTATIFGLVVGFVIVALTMFSAVVDNLREFGTLKAIGATTWDLAKVLFVQSVVYALAGSLIGLTIVTQVAGAIRSPKMGMILPVWLFGVTPLAMVVLCVVASSLSLIRLRKLEPAMVFR